MFKSIRNKFLGVSDHVNSRYYIFSFKIFLIQNIKKNIKILFFYNFMIFINFHEFKYYELL